ncbi:MAG: FMN-binding negative transcriptional regulator [Bacteroidetes bacterium]|jgi:transcriptional regulator|nr:FMN-binding negative transcriptional regulator [Bacteroidota bacterium]
MYIPKHYQEDNRNEIIAFMRQYSFAVIVTVKDNFQTATHLPFVIEEKGEKIILTSHFAKANENWKDIIHHQSLVIFSEPHAYISPKHYDKELNVPTWNYLSVHAYGTGRIIESDAEAFSVLEKMIGTYETDYKKQWDALPADYKNRMVKGIVAFEIEVNNIQAKKKLSQNKTESEKQRIISAFEKSESENERVIAAYMKKNKT